MGWRVRGAHLDVAVYVAGSSAEPLRVGVGRVASVPRVDERFFDGDLQQVELLLKKRSPCRWKNSDQAFQHSSQPAHDLHAICPILTNFLNRQQDKVLPVGRSVDQADLPMIIGDCPRA